MSSTLARHYCDSCVLISLIEAHPQRVDAVQYLLEQAERGDIDLITSTFTIAEVAFIATERGNPDPAVLAEIDKLWQPGAPIKLVEFTRTLATDARNLIRSTLAGGKSIKPGDAIHLATAVRYEASCLYSYDKPLTRYPTTKGVQCVEPPPPPLNLFSPVTN